VVTLHLYASIEYNGSRSFVIHEFGGSTSFLIEILAKPKRLQVAGIADIAAASSWR